ncbi:DNA repair protein RecN [Aggregatimonas sangjinii]|uniref:DNA repair protein RecN n=1 Tax=Aggregatimonas sangjinii TaxID=2583587 RepID=A0A5B7SP11_9FLAO|nr:DNA repair protein RecN [Aggregatimonas sangjinii]QCX00257.1 DNA repair protein RecN [Aggregatimonas sangjinii]
MLVNLSIKNFALIDDLNVSFTKGFTVITGETGAGKSILLGALSLVLGKRADLSSLRKADGKCVIEAEFQIDHYGLKGFFKTNDLDYEPLTIVRREILPSGKSRAFINDSPVTLAILSELGGRLIDVHSQHQTLLLTENDFQLKLIDALADNKDLLQRYKEELKTFQKTLKELNQLIASQSEAIKEYDYNSFLLQELESAHLKEGLQDDLETEYEQLNNVETILEQLSQGYGLLNDEQMGLLGSLAQLKQLTNRLETYGPDFSKLSERVQSVFLELEDIATDLEAQQEKVEADPQRLEKVNTRLQLLYDLQRKHNVQEIEALLHIQSELSEKVSVTENLEEDIKDKKTQLVSDKQAVAKTAKAIRDSRQAAMPKLKKQLEESLVPLGMPSVSFKMEVTPSKEFKNNGQDDLTFLFSANKGSQYGELKKVASGGELSRIMLVIKAILGNYENLPTMMFDEIDTGVSGEISNKMGDIMHAMSKRMQVFSITHLPQVASKGHQHYKVFKEEEGATTHTRMTLLDQDERVVELAEMLGGKSLTDSAMAHARQLLN